MELIDCHSHTALSGHGHGTLADAVRAAESAGLSTYCMTEHWVLPAWLDPENEDSIPSGEVEGYFAKLLRLRGDLEERGSNLELVIGAEVDWLGAERTAAIDPRLEYVLGSVHFIDGNPLDNEDVMDAWRELGTDGLWRRYLEEWLAMVESPIGFSAFAHPDLPKVFGERPTFDLEAVYDAMAEAVARRGAAVELNTAGWRKPAQEQYPSMALLKAFARKGVPCTVGCDGHKPEQVGLYVERAYEVLRDAGYRSVVAPTRYTASKGEWREIAL